MAKKKSVKKSKQKQGKVSKMFNKLKSFIPSREFVLEVLGILILAIIGFIVYSQLLLNDLELVKGQLTDCTEIANQFGAALMDILTNCTCECIESVGK